MSSKPAIGPLPTGRLYKDVPVPFFFQEETAAAFQEMEVQIRCVCAPHRQRCAHYVYVLTSPRR